MPKPGAATVRASGDRSPRINVEYEVWKFDAKGKVVIPFVTGVMSNITGEAPTLPVEPGADASKPSSDTDENFKPNLGLATGHSLLGLWIDK